MINRRDFLKSASLFSLGALAACNSKEATPAAPVENKNKGLGLQIYTLGPEMFAGDLNANMKRIREMGIKNLELAGYSADTHKIVRTLQVLGAYGFRGYFEKKPHFLASVPYALSNLRTLLQTPFQRYPYLNGLLTDLANMPQFNEVAQDKRLEVRIYSFAYKKGIPADTTGNGGGYVFDCRSINNPGKYEYYRQFNGTDPEVIKFLEDDGEVNVFLESVYKLVDAHVRRFVERNFTHMQVCFGCTGGQHRSVYCAEHLARHLADKYNIKVILSHRELNVEKIL